MWIKIYAPGPLFSHPSLDYQTMKYLFIYFLYLFYIFMFWYSWFMIINCILKYDVLLYILVLSKNNKEISLYCRPCFTNLEALKTGKYVNKVEDVLSSFQRHKAKD